MSSDAFASCVVLSRSVIDPSIPSPPPVEPQVVDSASDKRKKKFPGYRKAVLAVLEIDARNDPRRSRYGRSLLGLSNRIQAVFETGKKFRTGFLKRALLFLIEIGTVEKANAYRYRTTVTGRRQLSAPLSPLRSKGKQVKKKETTTARKADDDDEDDDDPVPAISKIRWGVKPDDNDRPTRTHKWQFLDGDVKNFPMGTWRDYDADASDEVEKAYQQYQRCPGLCDVRRVKSGHFAYLVSFLNMHQLNVDHEAHTQRPIRRVDA